MTRARTVLAAGLLFVAGIAFFRWRQTRSLDLTRVYTTGWATLPPLEVAGSDGKPTGLGVEIVREAARRRGIRLKWVLQETDPDTALRTGAVDLWPVVTITSERRNVFHISDPFLTTNHCLLVRAESPYRNLQDLATATIATSNSLIDGPALRRNFPRAHIIAGASVQILMEDLCRGSAAAAYMNEHSAVAALLDRSSCSNSLRWIAMSQERSELGIGATFQTALVADALRAEIASAAREHWLDPIVGQWGYASSDVQSIGDLLDLRKREWRLGTAVILFGLLLLAGVFQTARIRGERNRTRHAEQALRKAEQTLRLMADNLHETLIAFNMDHRLTYANPAFEKLTGSATGKLTMQICRAETLFPSLELESGRRIVRHWEAAFQGRSIHDQEYRVLVRDGADKWLSASWGPIFDDSGRQIGVHCSGHDITARKKVEEKLFETSLRLETLLSNSPLAVVEWTPEHRIANWFGGAGTLFGWSAEEAIGRTVEDLQLVCEDDWPQVLQARQLMELGQAGLCRNRNNRKDGSLVYCEWYNSVLPVSGSARPAGFSLVLDITGRTQAEDALRISEEKYRKIVEAAPIGILQSTVSGRFLSANPKLANMFGFDSAAQMMQEVTNIAGDLFANPEARHDILRRAEGSPGFVQRETVYKHRNGAHFIANLFIRAERDKTGQVAFLEGFVEDITERKQAEEALHKAYGEMEGRVQERTSELSAANRRLQELDRLKSQFLASMSHELRTPLNSIIGFAGLLRGGLTGPVNVEQKKQLDIIRSSSQHLLTLINDLLDVSLIEAGRADLHYENFDFANVAAEAIQSLAPLAKAKGLQVITDIPESVEMVCDRKRTLQLLLNLVNNAIKFTESGYVRVSGLKGDTDLNVSVEDSGIGIRPEHIEMLFEAFRQVDSSAKRIYEGTGLGLYLCRKLLELMGGEIRVESEFGKGTRFKYRVPLRPPAYDAVSGGRATGALQG
jgi:PAS domain S-box-containing protein